MKFIRFYGTAGMPKVDREVSRKGGECKGTTSSVNLFDGSTCISSFAHLDPYEVFCFFRWMCLIHSLSCYAKLEM